MPITEATEVAAHEFYEQTKDIVLKVGELYPTDSKRYDEFFHNADDAIEFYYKLVLLGRLTKRQALRWVQDIFETLLPELA